MVVGDEGRRRERESVQIGGVGGETDKECGASGKRKVRWRRGGEERQGEREERERGRERAREGEREGEQIEAVQKNPV